MDAKPATTVKTVRWLGLLCVIVTAVGVSWPAWDMFGPTRRPMLQGWDDSFYYFWLPSVIIDHDLDFSNQLAQSGTIDPATRDIALTLPRTRTGLIESKYPPGWAIGSLPFFLAAHAVAPQHATGFEPVYLVAVWFGQLLYAIGGLVLAIKLLNRWFEPPVATAAVLAIWLASPLVYYQTARLSMSHSQVFTLTMVVFWSAFQIEDGKRRSVLWLMIGFSSALLVVTRNAAFVYLVFPAVVLMRNVRSPRHACLVVAGAALPIAAQLVAWKVIFGSWIAYSYGGERFNFSDLHLAEVLFSPRHGWFYWHPLLLPTILLFVAWSRHRAYGVCWLISLLAIILFDAAWPMWWLGSSFGHRGFEVATFFAMIGFAAAIDLTRAKRAFYRTLWVIAALAIAWNVALLCLFLTQRIPREEPVTFGHAARALSSWISAPGQKH
jgi:hypothetical protein